MPHDSTLPDATTNVSLTASELLSTANTASNAVSNTTNAFLSAIEEHTEKLASVSAAAIAHKEAAEKAVQAATTFTAATEAAKAYAETSAVATVVIMDAEAAKEARDVVSAVVSSYASLATKTTVTALASNAATGNAAAAVGHVVEAARPAPTAVVSYLPAPSAVSDQQLGPPHSEADPSNALTASEAPAVKIEEGAIEDVQDKDVGTGVESQELALCDARIDATVIDFLLSKETSRDKCEYIPIQGNRLYEATLGAVSRGEKDAIHNVLARARKEIGKQRWSPMLEAFGFRLKPTTETVCFAFRPNNSHWIAVEASAAKTPSNIYIYHSIDEFPVDRFKKPLVAFMQLLDLFWTSTTFPWIVCAPFSRGFYTVNDCGVANLESITRVLSTRHGATTLHDFQSLQTKADVRRKWL